MSAKPRLVYGNGKGLGELPRLVLAELAVDFEDVRWPDEEWDAQLAAIKPTLPFGQVPLYEEGDFKLAQSMAIVRHLARKGKLYGKDETQAALVDMYLDGMIDVRAKRDPLRYYDDIDDETKERQVTKFFASVLPTWLGHFEKILADGRAFLLGDTFSVADIAAFNWFSEYHKLHPECFAQAPHVVAHVQRVAERPNIKAYLARRPETAW